MKGVFTSRIPSDIVWFQTYEFPVPPADVIFSGLLSCSPRTPSPCKELFGCFHLIRRCICQPVSTNPYPACGFAVCNLTVRMLFPHELKLVVGVVRAIVQDRWTGVDKAEIVGRSWYWAQLSQTERRPKRFVTFREHSSRYQGRNLTCKYQSTSFYVRSSTYQILHSMQTRSSLSLFMLDHS